MKFIIVKQRIRKLTGLQETFIELDSGDPLQQPPPPQPQAELKKLETHNHYGQLVESHHPNIYEVFNMTDNNISTSNRRAIGVDIGTGFIACAERDGDQIKFRKIRDAFFKLNPSKFLEGAATQFGENMLKNAGAHYVKVDYLIYVLGDDAFKFASLFHSRMSPTNV